MSRVTPCFKSARNRKDGPLSPTPSCRDGAELAVLSAVVTCASGTPPESRARQPAGCRHQVDRSVLLNPSTNSRGRSGQAWANCWCWFTVRSISEPRLSLCRSSSVWWGFLEDYAVTAPPGPTPKASPGCTPLPLCRTQLLQEESAKSVRSVRVESRIDRSGGASMFRSPAGRWPAAPTWSKRSSSRHRRRPGP